MHMNSAFLISGFFKRVFSEKLHIFFGIYLYFHNRTFKFLIRICLVTNPYLNP